MYKSLKSTSEILKEDVANYIIEKINKECSTREIHDMENILCNMNNEKCGSGLCFMSNPGFRHIMDIIDKELDNIQNAIGIEFSCGMCCRIVNKMK